jgi:WD40 repeat protein
MNASPARICLEGIDFSANGKVLASGGKDGTVRLWDLATLNRPRAHALTCQVPTGFEASIEDCTNRVATSPLIIDLFVRHPNRRKRMAWSS